LSSQERWAPRCAPPALIEPDLWALHYCDATIAMGKAKGLLVDDLNAAGVAYYNSIGQTAAAALTFNGDKAHFDKAGATEMAQLAAKELTRIASPLAAYLK
jgi:hypothetical protein